MKLNEFFKNCFSYAAGMERWCKESYFGGELKYTFAKDFAIADWVSGVKGVKETYSRVKKEWLGDYKAFTEVVIALNLLSWAHNQLKGQGFDGRDEFIALYSQLYLEARYEFYEKHGDNNEATSYFFEKTD